MCFVQERRAVISHKLDAQEALTKSNEVNMDLQAQTDVIIDARDKAERVRIYRLSLETPSSTVYHTMIFY